MNPKKLVGGVVLILATPFFGALPPPTNSGDLDIQVQIGGKSATVQTPYWPASVGSANASVFSESVTNFVTATVTSAYTGLIHWVDLYALDEEFKDSSIFVDPYPAWYWDTDKQQASWMYIEAYPYRIKTIRLEQDEGEDGKFSFTFTLNYDQQSNFAGNWIPTVAVLKGKADRPIPSFFPLPTGYDIDGRYQWLPESCAFWNATDFSTEGSTMDPWYTIFRHEMFSWATYGFENDNGVYWLTWLAANGYYRVEKDDSNSQEGNSFLVYERSFVQPIQLQDGSLGYDEYPIGKYKQQHSGGTVYTTHYLSTADAISQLQANSWEFTGAQTAAADPAAGFAFNPERADATKLQYSIQIAPGSTKLVLWQETFTPDGASQPSDVRWMSWNPGTSDSQSSVFTIDPLEVGNPHRFPGQPGKYNVVLISTYSELAVDANYDGRIELGTEGTSDQTSVDNPYHFLLDDEVDSADTAAAVSGPHALSVSGDRTVPGALKRARSTVNGIDDLKHFFPVFLSIKEPVINIASFLATYSPSTPVQYVLKQDDGALEFVYTDLARASAYDYLNGTRTTGFGPSFDQAPTSATIQQLTAGGVPLPQTFLDLIKNQGGGIILVKGLQTTAKPIYVEIFLGGTSQGEIPLQLTPENSATIERCLGGSFGNYQPITGNLAITLPGEQINLCLKASNSQSQISEIQWNIAGKVFRDYVATESKATLTELAVADLAQQKLTFYWADSGEKDVTVSFKIDGQPGSANVHFSVLQPIVTLTRTLGASAMNTAGTSIGLFPNEKSKDGIVITGSVWSPPDFPAELQGGAWGWIQTIKPSRTWVDADGVNLKWSFNNLTILDVANYTKSPIPLDCHDIPHEAPDPQTIVDAPSSPFSYHLKTPGTPTAIYEKVTITNETMVTYLMYRPPGIGARWVPLKCITWGWGISATRTNGVWSIDDGTPSQFASDGLDCNIHPIWTKNLRVATQIPY